MPPTVAWHELQPNLNGRVVRLSGKPITSNLGARLCVPMEHPNQVTQCVELAAVNDETVVVDTLAGHCATIDGRFSAAPGGPERGKHASEIGTIQVLAVGPCSKR